MVDLDAHRRILAWGLASGRLHSVEYNHLLSGIQAAESMSMQCAGKTPFREFAFANKIAQKQAGRHDCGMKAYSCPHCGQWHVGNKKPAAATRTFTRSQPDE